MATFWTDLLTGRIAWCAAAFLTGAAIAIASCRRLAKLAPASNSRPKQTDDGAARVVGECADLIDEVAEQIPSMPLDARDLADHMIFRLCEIVQRSGAEVIVNEASFDRDRHQVRDKRLPPQGAAIAETLVPGVALGRRILLRARVRLP